MSGLKAEMKSPHESETPTPFAVRCWHCGKDPSKELIYMTEAFYSVQMQAPSSRWLCPRCGNVASWDDGNYDERLEEWYERH